MNGVPLDEITLRSGAHENRESGVCLMEAAAWYAGEPHSDRPACVCPVLGEFGRGLNDCLPDDKRYLLLPFVPRVVGTAGDGHLQARGLMAMDWIIRVYTPTWLDLANLDGSALRALAPLSSWDDVEAAQPLLDKARAGGAAAWAAARAAARAAAWAAARAAAWDAAWAAARDAARAAARAAAWDAARDAVGPTRDALQMDAVRLFREMVALGSEKRVETPVSEVVLR